jgi:hypothetical protein
MTTNGEMEVKLHAFLTLAVDGGECWPSLSGRFIPGKSPCTYWIGICMGRSRGSLVTIVSDYGLDDGAIGVRSPAEAKDFSSSPCVQTGSEAHPASCTMGTGVPFPGAKRYRGVTLTTPPSSAEVTNE